MTETVIGVYTWLVKNLTIVMCHRRQKSIMLVAFSGELKFTGRRSPNMQPSPSAMSL